MLVVKLQYSWLGGAQGTPHTSSKNRKSLLWDETLIPTVVTVPRPAALCSSRCSLTKQESSQNWAYFVDGLMDYFHKMVEVENNPALWMPEKDLIGLACCGPTASAVAARCSK